MTFAKTVREKIAFCTFLGNSRISESAKKLQKLFGSTLSDLIICCFFDFWVRVIAQEAPKTLKWLSGCAHLLVHIRRRLIGALLRLSGRAETLRSIATACGQTTSLQGRHVTAIFSQEHPHAKAYTKDCSPRPSAIP